MALATVMCWWGLAEAGSRGASHVAPVSLCARRPLFVVKMLVEGDAFKFAPSQGGLVKAVQGVVDQFVAMMNTIPRIESELGKGTAGGARLLTVASVEEEMVMLAKQRLQALVEKNFALTAQMSAAYAPFVYVLSADTDKKVAP